MVFTDEFTTTVDQVALAFTSPMNLPDQDVYEKAITKAVKERRPEPKQRNMFEE